MNYLQPGSQIYRPNEAALGDDLRVTNLTAKRSFQLSKPTFWAVADLGRDPELPDPLFWGEYRMKRSRQGKQPPHPPPPPPAQGLDPPLLRKTVYHNFTIQRTSSWELVC